MKVVSPPIPEHYLSRRNRLKEYLSQPPAPTIMIVSACWDVMKAAFGSDLRVLWWMLLNVTDDRWEAFKYRAWLDWHLYVRLRTIAEVDELEFQATEARTGVDVREWPHVVVDGGPK